MIIMYFYWNLLAIKDGREHTAKYPYNCNIKVHEALTVPLGPYYAGKGRYSFKDPT